MIESSITTSPTVSNSSNNSADIQTINCLSNDACDLKTIQISQISDQLLILASGDGAFKSIKTGRY
jgi:hypothetical protein